MIFSQISPHGGDQGNKVDDIIWYYMINFTHIMVFKGV